MKRVALVVALVASSLAFARGGGRGGGHSGSFHTSEVRVHSYVRTNGSYVPSHMRTARDESFSDNWTTRGNQNPYTGKEGTRDYPQAR